MAIGHPSHLQYELRQEANGDTDYGLWFRNEGVPGLDILANALNGGEKERKQAEDLLNGESDGVRAYARRACLFKVTRPLKKDGVSVETTEQIKLD